MPTAVAVATSGGRDSTALLHATARAAQSLGGQVHALHVHHGLVAEADGWLEALRRQCGRWSRAGLPISFHARRLTGAPERGDSVEAWARTHRYAALAGMAIEQGCSLVLLAHHARDQAETVLLQALRGGGAAGIAAMPAAAQRNGIVWARPWLGQPRSAIEAYVRRYRLGYVDDASNDDLRYARNRLRRIVWPALTTAFPDVEAHLQAAASRAAEAAVCLAELAALDAASVLAGDALDVERWKALSAARRCHLLRSWLGAPDSLVRRLAQELPRCRSGRWPAPGGELRLYDGRLRFDRSPSVEALHAAADGLDLSRPGRYCLPGWQGAIDVVAASAGGVAPARLLHVSSRRRAGGEDFQLAVRGVARSLKKQYQARRVPPWERDGPLLYDGGQLLFAAGLGLDARCLAAAGEPQLGLRWLAHAGD